MKPTTLGVPLALALAGAVIAYLLEVGLVASGQPTLVPPFTFPLVLVAIAAIVISLGWPIRQALRGTRQTRLDPFRAMRVVLLSKATVLVGALLGGGSVGVTAHLLGRPVLAQGDDLLRALLSVAAGAVALIAGLVVEHWCRIPPDADDTAPASVQGQ